MLDKFGLNYAGLEKNGIIIPVLGVNVKYHRHLGFDDTIVIDTVIKDFTGVKMTVEYTAVNKATGEITTTGESTHCFLDAKTYKPLNMKKSFPEIYEKLKKIEEEL